MIEALEKLSRYAFSFKDRERIENLHVKQLVPAVGSTAWIAGGLAPPGAPNPHSEWGVYFRFNGADYGMADPELEVAAQMMLDVLVQELIPEAA